MLQHQIWISLRTWIICLPLAIATTNATAQDSLQQETIDIINTYQPKLRDAAKINLTATLPAIDTGRPRLAYNIPALNLYFMYQPIPLKPLAMGKDSLPPLQNNFIKAGFGNYATSHVQIGIGSNRNDRYNYSLFFNHLSARGNIKNQDFSNTSLDAQATYHTAGHALTAAFRYEHNGVYYYGYNHDSLSYKQEEVKQVFNTVGIRLGIKNTTTNILGIKYDPSIRLASMTDFYNRTENSIVLRGPLEKELLKDYSLRAELLADLSRYSYTPTGAGKNTVNNSLLAIHPALRITKEGFVLHAGLNPTWTNAKFYLLPDIVNETNLIKDRLILSSGWISYFEKNNFFHLVNKNPYWVPNVGIFFTNTRIEEKYTGIKGTIGSHLNYSTKFSYLVYNDLPLFVNDTLDGKTFYIRNEEELKAYQLHGEMGYIEEEKFQLRFSADWYNYFKQKSQQKPYHLVPFQANLYGQATIFKKFRLTADLFVLSGSYYLQKNGTPAKLKPAFDLNAGASYQINKYISVWGNVNNILGTPYQRWYNYPTYGLNALGGVLIKF